MWASWNAASSFCCHVFGFCVSLQYAKLAISLKVPGGGSKKKSPAAPQGGAGGPSPAAAADDDDYEGGLC